MKLLILGGTQFIGPHMLDAALARGHELTLFNRGVTRTSLPGGVEIIHGNRDPSKGEGLQLLRGRRWDAAIDTCGYVPRVVAASAGALADSVDRYLFISTISVYRDFSRAGIDENSPLATLDDPNIESVTGETYGGLKGLCENTAEAAMPGRTTIIRPGLIVGPGDPTDRFTYWPARIDHGGEVLSPGDGTSPVQLIDARDLADFTLALIEAGRVGLFNAVGPADVLTMSQMLDACRAVSSSDAHLTWVSEEFLLRESVKPWTELPVWVAANSDQAGFASISNARAIAAGLQFRPVINTARDTLHWSRTRLADHKWRAGLTADREAELLAKWHAEHNAAGT